MISVYCKTVDKTKAYHFERIDTTDCLRAYFTAKKFKDFSKYNYNRATSEDIFMLAIGFSNVRRLFPSQLIEFKDDALRCKYVPQK